MLCYPKGLLQPYSRVGILESISAWAGVVRQGGEEAGHGVEDQLFVGAPGRCDEEALWAVPGEAMDYGLSWQSLQALAYEVAVFI